MKIENGSRMTLIALAAMGLGMMLGGLATQSMAQGRERARKARLKAEMLIEQELSDIEGYVVRIQELDLDPGASSGSHRHDAHVFVYVVSGEIASRVGETGESIAYKAGETWYEPPNAVHAEFRNTSDSERAKAIAFFIMQDGKPMTVPVFAPTSGGHGHD